jgi:hypothetical protein
MEPEQMAINSHDKYSETDQSESDQVQSKPALAG